jgi:aminopeptidase YwaD
MRRKLVLVFLILSNYAFGQDLAYTRNMLDTLTSPTFWGRGYTKQGMAKAASFIENEFKSLGLKPMHGGFKQNFSFPVNTFPSEMSLKINGKILVPGKDFIIGQASPGLKANGKFVKEDSIHYVSIENRLILTLQNKLTWSVATRLDSFTQIFVKNTAAQNPENFEINVEHFFLPEFKASNICAIITGTKHPDSVVVITAHYDHLGGMGAETYFPGANDNASGVSFLLSLAKFYAKNPQPYTMAFICFGGEEAGILGSKYFTEHPLIPLAQIRFLINLDLVGTGEDGATVVNATQYPKEFAILNKINDNGHFLAKINPRGKAANSDHYFFTEKGVPAFFLYTQGGISAYHDVDDRAETLPFTVYENLFKLFVGFNKALMN